MLISGRICQYFSTTSAFTETSVKYDEHILNVGNKWFLSALLTQAGSHTVIGGESGEKSQWQSRPARKEEEEEHRKKEEMKEAWATQVLYGFPDVVW